MVSAASSTAALAQVGGSLAIESDYRLRGYSLSAGRPSLIGQISYDDSSGAYANLLVAGALLGGADPALVAVTGGAGYAKRLAPAVSIDGGVLHSEYPQALGGYGATRYTEVYLGLLGNNLASHVYFSPDYFGSGVRTLYAEVEATFRAPGKLRLNAHAGRLTYLNRTARWAGNGDQYDWRITASRRFGVLDLHLALSGGGPGRDYYEHDSHSKTVLTGGVGWTF